MHKHILCLCSCFFVHLYLCLVVSLCVCARDRSYIFAPLTLTFLKKKKKITYEHHLEIIMPSSIYINIKVIVYIKKSYMNYLYIKLVK